MNGLLELASAMALDFFKEAKLPCFMVGFSYYTRVAIACVAPVALSLAIVLLGYWWARSHRKTRTRKNMAAFLRAKKRGAHSGHSANTFKRGLWISAPYVLFANDLPVEIVADHFFGSNALQCTATARILIPAECSAVS